MKKILFLFIILFSLNTFASLRGDCPSYESEYGKDCFLDLNQEPVLKIIKEDLEDSNLLGNIHFKPQKNKPDYIYYQNGNIFAKTAYQNFKKTGFQEFFYPNQNLLARIPYQNDIIDGAVQVFYIDGTLKMTVTYQMGKKINTGKMFYQNGNLALTENYQNGLITGIQHKYYSNGNLQSTLSYQNGILNGPAKLFYNNGNILADLIFSEGKITQNICYTPLGEQSFLNNIGLYKLQYGMQPIECFKEFEAEAY